MKQSAFTTLSILLCTAALTLPSCKKSTTTPDPAPTTTTPATSSPAAATPALPSDANGMLVAIKLNTSITQTVPVIGTTFTTYVKADIGTAFFPTTAGGTTYADAGTVTVNTTSLDKGGDNKYTKVQQANQADFDLKTQVKWNVAGNSNVASVTNFYASNLPKYDTTYFAGILNNNTITKSNGITFSLSSKLSGSADSVYVVIVGGGSTVFQKAYASTVGSVTISSAQLSGLTNTTSGQFQITPYKITNSTFSGKKYYFVSEQAYVSTMVKIQ